ncbi:TetR/AcrR family transcriptional regulator [Mucilaginibacter sp. HMF5004]|uniref:TetR/AcrR family transcriptional regulator n=1 Tax=Mucilaginibacter rivuli TaxID=2857527 RepID=UPI001C5D110F|nr:TetR/AcrR family transcriptional regulator [Mucilaginibacter rivuli]MBW4888939.1 TetR/AcrR family transcriptional regulator [Mucilaginibacter rivuli]
MRQIKDKELTKRKLIEAVGAILQTQGFGHLGVNNIARKAGVNKKLIYRYFGGVDQLVEAYVVERDYWMTFSDQMNNLIADFSGKSTKPLVTGILKEQFSFFDQHKEMQSLILWELSTESKLMRSIHNAREAMGQKAFELTDKHFENTKVNFRAVSALLVGGIYYAILHKRFNGGKICDIDVGTEKGKEEILSTINNIIDWAYQMAEAENDESKS